jgi:ribosomal protein S18 acetylase RimI-like enzyme
MNFRLAVLSDLIQLKQTYAEIIQHMNNNQIPIWDDIYPCEFFEEDIKQNRLYLLTKHTEIIAAFALCSSHSGERHVNWENPDSKALYLDRLGINACYMGTGIGSQMLEKAKETAKALGADYLRLFAVDINTPAIRLYQKNGFWQADGFYDEVIDDEFVLHEYGYEICLT